MNVEDNLGRDEGPDPRVKALTALVNFVKEHLGAFHYDDAGDWLLGLTTMRSLNTTLAISNLLVWNGLEQAEMLCRPLFEDTVAMHWLVMQPDATFLIERFFDQRDAHDVREHDFVTTELGLPFPETPELANALARRAELREKFGRHAERPWWAARPDGSRITMAEVISEVESFEPYQPRLNILREHYALANRWAELQLHHTFAGLPAELTREGVSNYERDPLITTVAHSAYYSFGQTIHLQLTYGAGEPDLLAEFHTMYMDIYGKRFVFDPQIRAAMGDEWERQWERTRGARKPPPQPGDQ